MLEGLRPSKTPLSKSEFWFTHLYKLLGSRVRLFIGAADMLGSQMGVNLGGGYVGMPQQFLNCPQVGATTQHMSGKAMPQGVGADLSIQTG